MIRKSSLYTEYYFKQLNKIKNKKYEFYVITKILHFLNEPYLKFVTQQYVRLENKRYALTDLYFPALNLHIEIDEGHHYDFHKENILLKNKDNLRELDIVKATNHNIKRINVYKNFETLESLSLAEIDRQIDMVIKEIITIKNNLESKVWIWDIDKEFNPQTFIDKGYLDADEDILFQNSTAVMKCFNTIPLPRVGGGRRHPINKNIFIWTPKFYENQDWKNTISDDYIEIREYCKDSKKSADKAKEWRNGPQYRLVFARVKNNLLTKNSFLFRFYGLYKCTNIDDINGSTWKLISKKVNLNDLIAL